MEIASLLCLAEARRKRRRLLDTSTEKLSFLSKLYYPLWAISWDDDCLILDGLGCFSYDMTYMMPPDIELFIEHIERSMKVRESYRNALKSNAKTFADFITEDHIPMKGIISDRDILSNIAKSVKKGLRESEDQPSPSALVSPILDKKFAEKAVEKLVQNWMRIQSDIKGLQYAINVLNEEIKAHEEKILQEIEQIREIYGVELSRVKNEVDSQIERLISERDKKLQRITKISERETKRKLRKKEKIERELRKLELKRVEYRKRREIRKRRGDKVGVARWKYRLEVCGNKISEIRSRLQVVSSLLDRVYKEREDAIEKLNDDYQALIDGENKRVQQVEVRRDHANQAKKLEIDDLHADTLTIINLIKQLIEQKQQHASNLRAVTIPWKIKQTTMVYLPFYFAQYKSKQKSRYQVYSPAVAMEHRGILTKIQKALKTHSLESRITLLLHCLSGALDKMLSSTFILKIGEDKALGAKLQSMGYSNNLLDMPKFKEKLRKGIEELQKEGWIKSEEKDMVLNTYAQ
jgi:DNA repair exonuclease SbcCD ATPase subunit